MTPRALRRWLFKLPATPPITTAFEGALEDVSTWNRKNVWYSSQKEHWLGWLGGYEGPGFYNRKDWDRTAEYAYNHIVCPPMVLWLGEASGVPAAKVRAAKRAALAAKPSLSSKAAAIRRVIPWASIEVALASSVRTASR